MTVHDFAGLVYVADPETDLSNWDEWVGNQGKSDWEKAFAIDWGGENTPLVFESMTQDGIFESGEVWEFVLQDWSNSLGGPGDDFSSVGIAGDSTGWPPSTGSIIAIPEPATAMLLFVSAGVVGVIRRIRRQYGQ